LSKNEDNGKEAMIATIRLHLPFDDPAQLALRGCAYWIKQPDDKIKHPNTVLVGGGRETSHDNLRLASWQLIGGFLNAFENPNVVAGFYTYSGWFVPRSVALWCSRHIEGGLKPDWSKRSAFTKLQSQNTASPTKSPSSGLTPNETLSGVCVPRAGRLERSPRRSAATSSQSLEC
jgi:hypothetical protein